MINTGAESSQAPTFARSFGSNCAINEVTGDGRYVGRCWFYAPGDICPRHGDVSKAMDTYRETGKLTKEALR